MRTLAVRTKIRIWRLLGFCVLFLAAAFAVTLADAAAIEVAPATRDFWVWNLNVMPPGFRRASATLRFSGKRSLIYVEDKYYGREITADFLTRLSKQLEERMPAGALSPSEGIVPFEERIFGPLPSKAGKEERLIVLFADLGQYKDTKFDGFFNAFDQMTDAEAMEKFEQHSNEANVIYLNGFRISEDYTTGVIAHELQHLLSSPNGVDRESWLSESLAEGAMLLTGYYGDQGHVDRFLQTSWKVPLVSPRYVQYGPQLLFSSFLIDSLPTVPGTAIGALERIGLSGRDAVEKLFRDSTDVPLTFDAIFSNFVSYVFTQSNSGASLPGSWTHAGGIRVPKVTPYYTFPTPSGELSGQLSPYSFLAIDLSQSLSPSIVVKVERTDPGPGEKGHCANNASVLWKPVASNRIALYAVGCNPGDKPDLVQFRLKILDQPSLLPPSPFNILR